MTDKYKVYLSRAQKLRAIAMVIFCLLGMWGITFHFASIPITWLRWTIDVCVSIIYAFIYLWAIDKLSESPDVIDGHVYASFVIMANAILLVKLMDFLFIEPMAFIAYAAYIILRIALPIIFITTLLRFVKDRESKFL